MQQETEAEFLKRMDAACAIDPAKHYTTFQFNDHDQAALLAFLRKLYLDNGPCGQLAKVALNLHAVVARQATIVVYDEGLQANLDEYVRVLDSTG
ncbi:Uncharacterised protein [Chlamydia trachomatis]|jgi:hypothetical protein|uniref:hypothetical protein n=1 Tax=Ralstonia phage 1 NP-2014 TaxID=1460070 RepID=UPI0003EFCB69|nr:hypothetical protein [Ralstonia phage 1 NP-2014]AHI87749.1 hypothetical protein [Ralstonia phage 1 NP-2014]OAV66652.1 hypothetical protein Barb4_02814 [Bacteroidales bacterium Barb4]CRH25539.1 Uncharacterised protein [Chlamydia trachomatis]CRH27268.1 Uncharacterised protein [Chlamydia trachomatis]